MQTLLIFLSTDSMAQYRDVCLIQKDVLNTEIIDRYREYCSVPTISLVQTELISADCTVQYCLIQTVSFSAESIFLIANSIGQYGQYCSILAVLPVEIEMRLSSEPRIVMKVLEPTIIPWSCLLGVIFVVQSEQPCTIFF